MTTNAFENMIGYTTSDKRLNEIFDWFLEKGKQAATAQLLEKLGSEEMVGRIMEHIPSCPIPFRHRADTDPTGVKWATAICEDILTTIREALCTP